MTEEERGPLIKRLCCGPTDVINYPAGRRQALLDRQEYRTAMRTRVKICGITNLTDAVTAAEAGADALGFIFYPPSPRAVTLAAAKDIIRSLPPFVAKVGVFVNEPLEVIRDVVASCGLTCVQLHGDEPPRLVEEVGTMVPCYKAFRVKSESMVRSLPSYGGAVWLLDSYVAGQAGGTGECFNWDWAILAKQLGRGIILAGGLNPSNVAEAVRIVEPYSVDVASGVEVYPGKKDPALVRAFVQQATKGWADRAGLGKTE